MKKRCFVGLCLLGIVILGTASTSFAQPPDKAAIEEVLRTAPKNAGKDAATNFQWASTLDLLARGLAKLLADPGAFATLQAQMTASPLPENTVRLVDLLDVKTKDRPESFGALLATSAGTSEAELRAALAALPAPITLFFAREAERKAVMGLAKGRPASLQVVWDGFWIPQKNLETLLMYDRDGKRTKVSVRKPPAGTVLVVSTENSQAPEVPAAQPPAAASATATTTATCSNPFLQLTGLFLVDDHEGWPRGKPEYEVYLADWNPSMPGNTLTIRPTTTFIFSGRNVIDAAGRNRYLPDVNDKNRLYTFSPPIAMFQYNSSIGTGLYSVEDDTETGVLHVDSGNYSIGFTCSVSPGCTGPQCSGCKPTGSGIINLARAILGSGDDTFKTPFRSVGGAPIGSVLEADMGDWRLRYTVACP